MHSNIFTEISLIIAAAAVVSVVMRLLKQPLIIGYILTGILVGPSVFNLVHSEDTIDVFANLGIALLLFVVGLGLNPRVIKEVGKVAALTGIGQVVFTTIFGYLLSLAFGFSARTAIFIAIALAFSSTIIVLKLLTDKKEQTRLYGKISIGFLLVQDLLATIALLVASATGEGGDTSLQDFGLLALKGFWIAGFLTLISVKILPKLTKFIASSQEFLFLFAISWGFGIAALVKSNGFSLEVGALFAGVTLASMPYAAEVGSRLRPLRDFFIVLFFIALGANLGLSNLGNVATTAVLLSLLVLIGNPIIVITIMGLLGYTKKTSFKAGLAVAQVSEFSLVFVVLGQRTGQIPAEIVSLITLVAIITMAISSYMIIYADQLYTVVEKYLKFFERRKPLSDRDRGGGFELVLFGYKKGGSEFARVFSTMAKHYVVVDYDPEVVDQLEHQKIPYIYGDVTDAELLEEVNLDKAKLIASVIDDHQANVLLARFIHDTNPSAITIFKSDTMHEAAELYEIGATYVMMPHYLGSEQLGSFIKKHGYSKQEFKKFRNKHLVYLETHLNNLPD